MHVDQNFSVGATLLSDEQVCNLAGVASITRFHVNDERVVVRVVRQRAPAAMPRLPPALQCVGPKKIVFGRRGTRTNAVAE
jgi:hypothetical protein